MKMILELGSRGGKMIHVPSNDDSPIIYKGDSVQIANDFMRLVDDMKKYGYDKIAMSLILDRIHELLPIEDI